MNCCVKVLNFGRHWELSSSDVLYTYMTLCSDMIGCHQMIHHPCMKRMDTFVAQSRMTDMTEVRHQQKGSNTTKC